MNNPNGCQVIALPLGYGATVCRVCGWHERHLAGRVRWDVCPACGASFHTAPAPSQPGAVIPCVEFVDFPGDPVQHPGKICACALLTRKP